MDSFTIRAVDNSIRTQWNAYIDQQENATFSDRWQWIELVQQVERLPVYNFVAEQNGAICGVLSLTQARLPVLGNYFATAPFANYGGFYGDSAQIRAALLDRAAELHEDLGTKYVVVRHLRGETTPPAGWQQHPIYATYLLPLRADPDEFWTDHLRAKLRNQIGKSLEQGLTIRFGREALLDDFWQVISRSMRELGSPYHSRAYVATIMALFGEKMEFAVMYAPDDGKPAGGSLLIYDGDTAVHYHANTLFEYRPLAAGNFLYWSVIKHCMEEGYRTFDMGRSLVESGNEHFKMQWRPDKHLLGYWYHLRPGVPMPDLNQDNPRLQVAASIWRKLPLPVTRALGPHLIRGVL